MMNDDCLDRLWKLGQLFDICSKMGGTPALVGVQEFVSRDLKELVAEMREELEEQKLRTKTPHEIRTSGNAQPTTAPLPEGVDEQGRPIISEEDQAAEEERLKMEREAEEREAIRRMEEEERRQEEARLKQIARQPQPPREPNPERRA